MDEIDNVRLPRRTRRCRRPRCTRCSIDVRVHETIYKQAGAVHGCALATNEAAQSEILMFVEDVGRHNAVDAIAGQMWLDRIDGGDKIFYTTGRLTSEMVIKAAQMGIPFLVSRSGLTQMGYEIAEKVGITMIGRATSKHYLLFTGAQRFRRTRQTAAPERMDTPTSDTARKVTGIVLAGGQGRRMGGVDKGLQSSSPAGRWSQHVLARLAPAGRRRAHQRQPESRRATRASVIRSSPTRVGGFAGPLAGLHAGLTAARS